MSHQSWSIIILCFNEEGTIRSVTEKTREVLGALAPGQGEIIIVDDASKDGSRSIIQEMLTEHRDLCAVFLDKNLGYGGALHAGYSRATKENVCAIPGDGQFQPSELLVVGQIEPNTFISFTREKQEGYGWVRLLISFVNRRLNEHVLGVRVKDVNWVKAYRLRELNAADPRLRSMLVNSELCAKLVFLGGRCIEFPSIYHPRVAGRSTSASPRHLLKAAWDIVSLVREVNSFKRRVPIARTKAA